VGRTSRLLPFFTYFGGKHSFVHWYPPPLHDSIVEPFAGSAAYSLLHGEHRQVLLVDANPVVVGTWEFLIRSDPSDIMALPVGVKHADELKCCQEARWLIGWWWKKGETKPSNLDYPRLITHRDSRWTVITKQRIARQVSRIKHWKVRLSDYAEVRNKNATWFIDPPYERSGRNYPCKVADRADLADWCKSRCGQTIVCEQSGASWLPFRVLGSVRTVRGTARGTETVWYKER
jgi:site-specific DNA-adenine methylase